MKNRDDLSIENEISSVITLRQSRKLRDITIVVFIKTSIFCYRLGSSRKLHYRMLCKICTSEYPLFVKFVKFVKFYIRVYCT